jgi:OOP family OmpA-OmpF porin
MFCDILNKVYKKNNIISSGTLRKEGVVKSMRFIPIVILVAFFLGGCAGMEFAPRQGIWFFHEELPQADRAIEAARLAGKDSECPAEFNEAAALRDKAYEIYLACRTDDAKEMAMAARDKARSLCLKKDSDGDGVTDDLDRCPNTPKGVRVDSRGCPLDSDGDGVPDYLDECPNTPRGVKVDEKGCPLDSDGDGVPDYKDECPNTPRGVIVDGKGCPLDSDGDGVPDYKDECPGTPKGATVDSRGCWVIKGINFDFDKWDIKSKYYSELNKVVHVLEKNPSLNVEIHGHTDSMGTAQYNQKLSENRAKSVMRYFIEKGIDSSRLSAIGYGESRPVAYNRTDEGRARNRRVELNPLR